MRWFLAGLLVIVFGCNGDAKDDTDLGLTCDDVETTSISSVAVTDWPTGLDVAIPSFRSLAGQWTVASCGSETNLTIDIRLPSTNDSFEIITAGLPAQVTCGADDARFSSDFGLDPVGYATADVAVVGFTEPVLTTMQVDADVTLFAGSAGLIARTNGRYVVPLAELSRFETADIVVRSEPSGPSGQVTVTTNTGATTCELTGWTRR